MQPFLSGETTLALLLTLLTLLLFAAAGDEHPYEPSHHNFSARVEKQRSSVELDTRPPVQVEELTIRLDALQHEHQSGESGNVERGESRTEVVKRSIHKGEEPFLSFVPYMSSEKK